MIGETRIEHLEQDRRELAIKADRSIDCNLNREEVRHAN